MNIDDILFVDLIPTKTDPIEGSIKETRINGILSEKVLWKNSRWTSICRFSNCSKESGTTGLCPEHTKFLENNVVKGHRVKKNDRMYEWNGRAYKLICSICFKSALKNGRCKAHKDTQETQQSVENMFESIKQDLIVKKSIDKKKKINEDTTDIKNETKEMKSKE